MGILDGSVYCGAVGTRVLGQTSDATENTLLIEPSATDTFYRVTEGP